MKKALLLVFLLLLSSPLRAWDEADHQRITALALEEVSAEWKLDQPVEVRPLSSFLNKLAKIRPGLSDPKRFAAYLKINPEINLEREEESVAGKNLLTPAEILSQYALDPDDGRDQNLFQMDEKGVPHYIYPDQKWFGAMKGGNSQAFRHLEKPPFSLKHPGSTFGVPPWAVGEATQRAEIYFQLSQLAFSLDENYWGWRFLAGSLHYLEDLHQPYHAGQVTPSFLLRGLGSYWTWGRKTDGFMGTFSHLVSNSHRFYESYVSMKPNSSSFRKEVLGALKGTDHPVLNGSVKELALQVRDRSNRLFPTLMTSISDATSPVLFSPYWFKSARDDHDDPEKFLDKNKPDYAESVQKVFEITKDRFESMGKVIRTVVDAALKNKKESSEELLKKLDRLLQPTSS
jgi:hypothetical protein